MRSLISVLTAIVTRGLTAAYRETLPEISQDSVDWIEANGVSFDGGTVLEVGCGLASTAGLVRERGGHVVAIDIDSNRVEVARNDGVEVVLGDAHALHFKDGAFDLILSINVLEHLEDPRRFLAEAYRCLRPGQFMYLAWTNWLSPLGGHDFSPFHYLGPRLGYRVACKLRRRQRFLHVPYETVWPMHIGPTLRMLGEAGFQVAKVTPRYCPRLSLICRIPWLREFLTVNCQVIAVRK